MADYGGGAAAKPVSPPPWPDGQLVQQALGLLTSGEALALPLHPIQQEIVARLVSPKFKAVLYELGGPYVIRVNCNRRGCSGTFGRWVLNPGAGIATVYDEPRRPEDRSEPRPWTKAAAEGKGYRQGPTTADANGSFTFCCSKCRREICLGPEKRTERFLQALKDQRIFISV